jgi:hypothetical protein
VKRVQLFPKLLLKSSNLLLVHLLPLPHPLSPFPLLLLLLDDSLAALQLDLDLLNLKIPRKLKPFQLPNLLRNSLLPFQSSLVVVDPSNLPRPLLVHLVKLARRMEFQHLQHPLLPLDELLRRGIELRLYRDSRILNPSLLKPRNDERPELRLPQRSTRVNCLNRNLRIQLLRNGVVEPVSEEFKPTTRTKMRRAVVTERRRTRS